MGAERVLISGSCGICVLEGSVMAGGGRGAVESRGGLERCHYHSIHLCGVTHVELLGWHMAFRSRESSWPLVLGLGLVRVKGIQVVEGGGGWAAPRFGRPVVLLLRLFCPIQEGLGGAQDVSWRGIRQ